MYKLSPATGNNRLFFNLDGEDARRHGAIGYLRANFGANGLGFHITWFDKQPHLKTKAFRREIDSVINGLRTDGGETPLSSRKALESHCAAYPGKALGECGSGYIVETDNYSYYFRCDPGPHNYDVYCFTYDNSYLLPELEGQHELPLICFSTLPSTGELILISRNSRGYTPTTSSDADRDANRIAAESQNELRGITRAQEEAMLAGSLFGWGKPAAKPWNYDLDGSPRALPPGKNELER
jgi:hypothetical protein